MLMVSKMRMSLGVDYFSREFGEEVGTLVFAGNTSLCGGRAREVAHWNLDAMWRADVVAFWIGKDSKCEMETVFRFGVVMARPDGIGPRRVVVSAEWEDGVAPVFEPYLDVWNDYLSGRWKVCIGENIDAHIKKIKSVLGGVSMFQL